MMSMYVNVTIADQQHSILTHNMFMRTLPRPHLGVALPSVICAEQDLALVSSMLQVDKGRVNA